MTYDDTILVMYEDMVTERHRIWQHRQANAPGPWTTNPVLSKMKMTNMFRVLDPGSQFVFQLASSDEIDTITRLVFYRITNRPETWYAMRNMLHGRWPVARDFTYSHQSLLHNLLRYRDQGGQIFSGAYVIIPEPGTKNDKVEGAFNLVRGFATEKAERFLNAGSQEEKFAVLRSTHGLGPFLSMQILTDWNYLQPEEPDLSFVIAGPGAKRGAKALNPSIPAEDVIYDMAAGLWLSHPNVQLYGRGLTPMDVQNTMCELSKYLRELNSPRKTTPYRPAHPGRQAKPIVPMWW